MGRTAAVALAIAAVLATTATSRAATVTYDLSGLSSYLLANGIEIPAGPGSSLTLDLDANGDGNSGDVTVVNAAILIQGNLLAPLFSGYGSLDANFVLGLSGGLGQIIPEPGFPRTLLVLWSTPASYFVGGSATCSGQICDLVGWQPGTPHTYADFLLAAAAGTTAPTSLALGVWNWGNGGQSFSYCTKSLEVLFEGCGYGVLNISYLPNSGDPPQWIDAIVLAGVAVPEPAPLLLLAPALLALALRSRASGTMRRHEAD